MTPVYSQPQAGLDDGRAEANSGRPRAGESKDRHAALPDAARQSGQLAQGRAQSGSRYKTRHVLVTSALRHLFFLDYFSGMMLTSFPVKYWQTARDTDDRC